MKLSNLTNEAEYKYPVNPNSRLTDPEEQKRLHDISALYNAYGHFLGRTYSGDTNAGLRTAKEFLLRGSLKKPRTARERHLQHLLLTLVNDDGSIKPREEVMKKDSINEISSEALAKYKPAAGASARAADAAGDYDTGHKRFKGIMRATQRELDRDAEAGRATLERQKHTVWMKGYKDGLNNRTEFNTYPKDTQNFIDYNDGYRNGLQDRDTHWESAINTKSMIKEFNQFKKAKK